MPNRTICDVLGEMRTMNNTRNYAYLLSLIEEVQSMANRMESALWDQREIKDLRQEIKKLELKKKTLKEKNNE